MGKSIQEISFVEAIKRLFSRACRKSPKSFHGSEDYWIRRYAAKGNSGHGSYQKLAEFKAELLNSFIQQENIQTVIEYGCGDGNQLKLAEYPAYTGFDVSPAAINLCQTLFVDDPTKQFKLIQDHAGEKAQLTLSLDVLYHLVEDEVFAEYMARLFDSSQKFVIIYSTNMDTNTEAQAPHVRHRAFSQWVDQHKPEWQLLKHIPNKYPFTGDIKTGSLADFFIYRQHAPKMGVSSNQPSERD